MRRHVVWAGIVSLAFQTDVHGSQSRAKNTALDTGLENWQNSHFPGEKVTRNNMLCWALLRRSALWSGRKENRLNMND
jgi:hypothetical protein